ncbi:MAG: thymidine phosphorylase, partial [Acidobacteriota bacterium]|nr:thymidine phosphorylase [Acidobacteriota bacterium]
MNPQELIRKKRDGKSLTSDEMYIFVAGVTGGVWADYQTSALLMAMFMGGLSLAEQNALTSAMLESGEILDFSDIDAPKADKHSTGGVGDKTSLLVAPIVAACGVAVPMISGRGLGHTGGTLDKLEAIEGYNVNLSAKEFHRIIKKCGFALAGQTENIVPADKKLYALRDATATVESIPLIVASIMSKKLAEGLDALVLDVKTGTGAFMQSRSDAGKLAEALVETGMAFNVKTEAVISDMNQPLGKYVGNALEVFECLKLLRNETDLQMQPTLDLSIELAARILILTGICDSIENSKTKIQNVLASGEASEKFRQNIELQSGNPKICDAPELLFEKNLLEVKIESPASGYVLEIDTTEIGKAISAIGGGRMKIEDRIDYAVGYACEKKLGDKVEKREPLGTLFCRAEKQAAKIVAKMQAAYKIGEEKPAQEFRLIKEIVRARTN